MSPETLLDDPYFPVLQSLRREVGAALWTVDPDECKAFLCEWTRQLARIVEKLTVPQLHEYGESVVNWASSIIITPDNQLLDVCIQIHDAISEIDNDDGWPVDRAGSALNHTCLGAIHSLDLNKAENSRWPAHASCHVWEFATGARNGNEVVSISRMAWQRHLFGQTAAVVRSR